MVNTTVGPFSQASLRSGFSLNVTGVAAGGGIAIAAGGYSTRTIYRRVFRRLGPTGYTCSACWRSA